MRKSVLIFPILLAACAGEPQAVAVPDPLKPASGERLAMIVPAKGVQIYECKAKAAQPSEFDWAFTGPEAELFDTRGVKIGRHYGGPTWESADGSKITGTVKARADAPQPKDIPWLLLTASQAGATGGAFSAITGVQRVNTVGGIAPAGGCTAGNAGAVARVPYTADYYLLSRR